MRHVAARGSSWCVRAWGNERRAYISSICPSISCEFDPHGVGHKSSGFPNPSGIWTFEAQAEPTLSSLGSPRLNLMRSSSTRHIVGGFTGTHIPLLADFSALYLRTLKEMYGCALLIFACPCHIGRKERGWRGPRWSGPRGRTRSTAPQEVYIPCSDMVHGVHTLVLPCFHFTAIATPSGHKPPCILRLGTIGSTTGSREST